MSGKKIKTALNRASSILVACAIFALVLFPLYGSVTWARDFIHVDSRKLSSQAAFQQRAIDSGAGQPKLFGEGLLSVTFDDGYESVYQDAYPLMQKYGIHSTQFVLTGVFKDEHYISLAQIKDMQRAGHDIACHSVVHPDLTTLDDEDLPKELHGCQDYFKNAGIDAKDFAAPYGHTDARTLAQIRSLYRSQRNSDGDIRAVNGVSSADVNTQANFDRYNLIGITVRHDTSIEELKSVIDYAITNKAWVILTYHQIDEPDSQFGLQTNMLEAQLKFISQSPIRIITINQVMFTPVATEARRGDH